MNIFFYIITSCISMSCIFFSVKKYKNIIEFFLFSFLVIIMGLSYGQADYSNYVDLYEKSYFFKIDNFFDYEYAASIGYSKDMGYTILCKIFNELGLSYQEFKFLLACMFLGMLFYISKKINNSIYFVISLYMVYPFFMDVIQVRNFIIEIILFIGIYFMSKSNKGIFIYIICILIATTIHAAALIFLPFVFFIYLINHKYLKYIPISFGILGLLMPIYSDYLTKNWLIIKIFFQNSNSLISKYGHYIEKIFTGGIFSYIYVLMIIFFLYVIKRKIKFMDNVPLWKKKYTYVVYNMYLYLVLTFPLYPLFSEVATRIPRDCIMLFASVIGIYLEADHNVYVKLFICFFSVVMILLFGYIDLYYPATVWNVDVIMNNNILFDLLL